MNKIKSGNEKYKFMYGLRCFNHVDICIAVEYIIFFPFLNSTIVIIQGTSTENQKIRM